MYSLLEKFKIYDENLAIISENESFSYNQLYLKIKDYKRELEQKIVKGSVVAILGDYSFNNIALLFALYENKNIIVPISSKIKEVIEIYLDESFSQFKVTIVDNRLNIQSQEDKKVHQMVSKLQRANHSGLILFSSGSTGKPKAMIHNLDILINSYKDKKSKAMNMLLFLMFDHIGGLNTLFNCLSMGSALVIPKKRDAKEICYLIEKYKIRVLPSSPTFLNLILISGEYLNHDLKSLRMITYGTESMPESLLKKLKDVFPRVKFLQTFGTSETGISTTSSKSSDSLYMKLDDPNCEYKIIHNELYLKSKTQVLGYLNASMDSFTDDGWFKTGDLVEELEDGYLKIIGRGKEVINVGGEKVLPSEVESVILEIANVVDCMAYSEKNAITGQTVVCDIVYKNEISQRELKKIIRAFCKNRLEAYKIPTKVNLVEKTNFSDRFKKIRRKN